ncbi:Parvalbumin [Trema orientale]|uniref:Parvalbumin n=1 Tax=Trema orientale TaxID=63057 RepID=A0A2P5C8K2_TREOI|nr:Parvalbumin [Trema orientale]
MAGMARRRRWFIILLIISIIIHSVNGRSITNNSFLISDHGVDQTGEESTELMSLINLKTTTTTLMAVTCEPIYDFLPCTTTLSGLLFMVIVYEVLLSFGDRYISAGSDLFFETFGTGFFGASLFHLLGTVPSVGLILVAGITASSESIEEQAEMSMGLLAGTTIMSLTLIWGFVVAFGNHDLSHPPNDSSLEEHNTKPFTLTGYGITTDVETSVTARIMLVSLIPFFILQLAKVVNSSSGIRVIVLVSFIVSVAFLVVYCIYQMFEPWIQNRRLEFVLRKYIRKNLLQSLLTEGRRPNVPVIKEIFRRIDKNGNSYISTTELRALILGIQIEHTGLDEEDFVTRVMEEFDVSGDSQINEAEFVKGLSKWLISAKDSLKFVSQDKQNLFNISSQETTTEEQQSLISRKKNSTKATDKAWFKYIKAALFIVVGTAITFVLAEPLMDTVQEFSTAAGIPSFLISYVIIPLALNFGQALSAITSAKHKTENAISLTLSEIYNGVFLNNIMGLIILLGLVYLRNLSWNVSVQVLVVLIICTIMGLYTSFCTKFPVWTSIVAFALYPISLLSIYLLTYVFGWS